MRGHASAHPTLISALWPTAEGKAMLRNVLLAIAGSLLLTISAKIQVPFWPVPMTMQTFAVLVIGMAFGPRLGVATVALYLLEGAAGLPVFAKGAGLAYMAGPTGGYLAGFVVSVWVVGSLSARGWDRSVVKTLAANTIGTAIIFACGLAWLSSLIGFDKALAVGVVPFLAGAALKIALAAALMPACWKMLGRKAG